jgi:shikimate kinase
MRLVILTGASGAGKTAIARTVAERLDQAVQVFHFDSIGVPSTAEMIDQYGSAEGWQRAKTIEWFEKLAGKRGWILFEGQVRIAFLDEAARAVAPPAPTIILVDCDDATRARRLTLDRGQPELANPTMFDWARYLRIEAQNGGYTALDTSNLSLEESAARVLRYFERYSTSREADPREVL